MTRHSVYFNLACGDKKSIVLYFRRKWRIENQKKGTAVNMTIDVALDVLFRFRKLVDERCLTVAAANELLAPTISIQVGSFTLDLGRPDFVEALSLLWERLPHSSFGLVVAEEMETRETCLRASCHFRITGSVDGGYASIPLPHKDLSQLVISPPWFFEWTQLVPCGGYADVDIQGGQISGLGLHHGPRFVGLGANFIEN